MKARLLCSLTIGAAAAAALVAFEDKFRRAALVASAARSGGHQTVTSILVDGFVGVTLIVAAVVFVLGTVAAARARARGGGLGLADPAPRRRRRAAAGR